MKKKGQEMSVSTLVLIVIGIVVLVMLILGFSVGWQNLWNKINIFQGGSVEDVINGCKIAATSDATYSYCSEFKKVTIGGQTQYINCESPVIVGLDKKLTCAGNEVKDECVTLAKGGTDLKVVLVNGKACGLTCTEDPLKGVLADSCPSGKAQYKVDAGVPDKKVCCAA